MNRLVLLLALVAIAYATPVPNMIDVDVKTPLGKFEAEVGKDGLEVSLTPSKKVKSHVGKFVKGLADAAEKGAEVVGKIGDGIAKGVAHVVDGAADFAHNVADGVGNALDNVAEAIRKNREENKLRNH
ncbi:hypothetical protein O3G_MSEX009878 [Manduca sexta]|uniref:Uncharacterized protein n=1 Tax=Manduca sexta TaxID=7130 RepID=A0A921ZEU6_MANSE|nr:hypothetical protein O3G_MSEX009878 [Manduca sexta]